MTTKTFEVLVEKLQSLQRETPRGELLSVIDLWSSGLLGLRALVEADKEISEYRRWIKGLMPPEEK